VIRRSRIQQSVLGLVFAVGLTARPALGQPPSVTGFTPRHGPPGTLVKIIGENFREVSAVEFDGVGATTFWIATSTHLKAVVPEGAVTGPIEVVTSEGAATSPVPFVVEAPAVAGFFPTLATPRPNPARDGTLWRFTLSAGSRARLAIFDARGHRVRLLLDERLPAGAHERLWDARDDGGRRVPPGVYYGRLEAQGRRLTHHVAVIR